MEVISIDGVEYVRITQAAREFKYTTDYVGQLCRARKVDSKLIGRTWYVNLASLTSHKKDRYARSRAGEITSITKPNEQSSRLDVEPVLRRTTVKVLPGDRAKANFAKRIEWKPARYESDESTLIPQFTDRRIDPEEPRTVKVNLASAQDLEVKGGSEATEYTPTPLPEIALRGGLKIVSADVDYESAANNMAIPSITAEKQDIGHPVQPTSAEPVALVRSPKRKPPSPVVAEQKFTYDVAIRTTATPSFTPELVKNHQVNDNPEQPMTRGLSFWVASLTLSLAVIFLCAVLSLEFSVSAELMQVTSTLKFSL